jgi:WD40 repeat protein
MLCRALCAAALLALGSVSATAETVVNLANPAPDGAITQLLLTDGRVLVQGFAENDVYTLTPDNKGSYVNGTWKRVATLPQGYVPLYVSSAVLADGRVVFAGGEYLNGGFAFTNKSALYDPVKDKWTDITPDKHLLPYIGDSPATVLADGRFMVGEKFKKADFVLDPKTLTWSEIPSKGKDDFNAEEGWTLMPDNSVLTFDVKTAPKSERYLPNKGKWVDAGSTVVTLAGPQNCCGDCIPYGPKGKCYDPPGEVGPAILRPDGTVFAAGAIPDGESTAHTSIYDPSTGKWTAGPDFPNGDQAMDTFASLLPDGNVLVEGSNGGQFYEFDGKNLTRENFSANGIYVPLLVLPTGEVLIAGDRIFQSSGTYKAAWAPTVTSSPASVNRGSTYTLSGTQFNGLSQANAFGDEDNQPTNYPLVRITNNSTGHVFYARTHDHSTMGVATGSAAVSTSFDVPSSMETGSSKLEVVANGIPSTAVSVTVN